MAIIYYSSGAGAASTAGVTAPMPTGATDDDLLILAIEGEGENTSADLPPTGGDWTAIDGSTGSVASATDGSADRTRLSVYWAWYNASINRTVPDAGNHTIARIYAFRGVDATTPIDVVSSGSSGTNATIHSAVSGISSTVADTMAVLVYSHGDGTNTNATQATNSVFTVDGSVGPYQSDSGSDGSLMMAYGAKSSAWSLGTWSWATSTTEERAWFCFALKPASTARTGDAASSFGWSDAATGTRTQPPISGDAASAWGWSDAATGEQHFHHTGDAASAWGWADAATGDQRYYHAGNAASAWGWSDSATGTRTLPPAISGDAASAWGWSDAATGTRTLAPAISGGAASSFVWSVAATGTRVQPAISGNAASAWGWAVAATGNAEGTAPVTGDAASSFGWTIPHGLPVVLGSTSYVSTASETSPVIAVPGGVKDGDILYLAAWLTAAAGSITPLDGWVPLYSNAVPASSTSSHASLFRRVAGTEPSDYTLSGTSGRWSIGMIRVSGEVA